MKTLSELLRDADPIGYEPHRSAHERRIARQTVLTSPHMAEDLLPRRPMATVAVVALMLIGIAVGSLYWSRAATDVVAAVRFEVRLAEENPAADLREAIISGTSRKIYLHGEPVVTNSDIARAEIVQWDGASPFSVSVVFNSEGAAKMLRATQRHIGRP
jgi:preprotein translocase subunit SecD